MMIPLAHVGHWIEWVIYLGPVVGIAAWIKLAELRERRRARSHPPEGPAR